MPVVDLRGLLRPREADALRVHHDDVVAGVGVGCIDGLVLAAEDLGDLRGQSPQHSAVGIDDVPASFDVARSGREGLGRGHQIDSIPSRSVGRWTADARVYLRLSKSVKGVVAWFELDA